MPVWTNTETRNISVSVREMFDSMCRAALRAQKFIFLEYFIIEEGVMWDTIPDILREKAAAGLDVRAVRRRRWFDLHAAENYDRYLMRASAFRAVRFNRFIRR